MVPELYCDVKFKLMTFYFLDFFHNDLIIVVGPALGSKGVNIMAFSKDYNARTADKAGYVIPVEITVYDVGFSFLSSGPINFDKNEQFCLWFCGFFARRIRASLSF